MKKKVWLITGVTVILVLVLVWMFAGRPQKRDRMQEMLDQVETALGEEWEKQRVTEVYQLTYADNQGNTIPYYICLTEYFESDHGAMQIGLDTDAISAVIDLREAESCRECNINGLPAVICQKDGRAYLCWTAMPQLSLVIEYDPAVQREEDIFRMAQSVPAGTDG